MRAQLIGLLAGAVGLAILLPAASAQVSCEGYFTASQKLSDSLTEAYRVMNAKDAAGQAKILPVLQSHLNALPAQEVKAEACSGTHINAYTNHQFAELSFLRARGFDIGFPANLPIVKQPDLNHAGLAYSVGWIMFEQGRFDEALPVFQKGLAMFPHDMALQNEYLATLIQLKRHEDVKTFVDKVLSSSFNLDDTARGKNWHVLAVARFATNDLAGADEALTVSMRYKSSDEATKLQTQVRAELAKKN